MNDKPLHVQVAEALGWAIAGFLQRFATTEDHDEAWYGRPPEDAAGGLVSIPRYDIDWSATGPLIEKYGITLDRHEDYERLPGKEWLASAPTPSDDGASGSTPLLAVCYLFLALKAAGKLEAA